LLKQHCLHFPWKCALDVHNQPIWFYLHHRLSSVIVPSCAVYLIVAAILMRKNLIFTEAGAIIRALRKALGNESDERGNTFEGNEEYLFPYLRSSRRDRQERRSILQDRDFSRVNAIFSLNMIEHERAHAIGMSRYYTFTREQAE
jgi:hypothetical protein